MFIVENYGLAIMLCVITMFCWGSWANTTKLTTKTWRFELFYWDYGFGILLTTLLLAFTLGSNGMEGRAFLEDFSQANQDSLTSAFIGGVIFNAANILLVAAIAIAGMSVAFPVAIGIALVLGVLVNYISNPQGDPTLIFGGVALITLAILLNAKAYQKLQSNLAEKVSKKGLILSIVSGCLMGLFYKYVAESMVADFNIPEAGKLTPYTALVIFAVGVVVSSFVFNTIQMKKPFIGVPVSFSDYFKGATKDHLIGIFGGAIWCVGMSLSIIASGKAGPAISYGLGQGATVVAAIWGIYIWKEFDQAPKGTKSLLNIMLLLYIAGLAMIILSK
ncbi:GRP family sugar transporter [Lutibacter sp.]|uniref:GRP family sugar transporter n=1 Tax=Lutibacter sp. TaxID=1925666 RepID=UPI002736A396|nr:GRP family sugar transporter [Lutibacter sp.]MDP3313117.1 L-rhamnose/proton symporter RhaT [Lutibacter sp.]